MCNHLSVVQSELIDQVRIEVENGCFYSNIISYLNAHVGEMYEEKLVCNMYHHVHLCISTNSFFKQQILWEYHNTPFASRRGLTKPMPK